VQVSSGRLFEFARDLHHAITRPSENVLVVLHDAEIEEQVFLVLRTVADGLHSMAPRTRYRVKTELMFQDLAWAGRIVEAGYGDSRADESRLGTIHWLQAAEMPF
jgi:hypothetical protein